MMKLAVIGKDVSQSESPRIHDFILGKMGLRCVYDKISLSPAEFSARAEELFGSYDGFNVTIPYKGEIIPYLSALRGDAAAFGAVNTVVCKERAGYNTDGYGFLMMLRGAGISPEGRRVLVLGAGGAGRSCIRKLTEAGAHVFAYERDEARLRAVHEEFGGFTPLGAIPREPFDVAVNCTGVGMHDTVGKTPQVTFSEGGTRPAGEELLSRCGAAVDLIYTPAESEFLRIARSLGKPAVNGAAMLFYQAYLADCIFTGNRCGDEEARSLWNEYRRIYG